MSYDVHAVQITYYSVLPRLTSLDFMNSNGMDLFQGMSLQMRLFTQALKLPGGCALLVRLFVPASVDAWHGLSNVHRWRNICDSSCEEFNTPLQTGR